MYIRRRLHNVGRIQLAAISMLCAIGVVSASNGIELVLVVVVVVAAAVEPVAAVEIVVVNEDELLVAEAATPLPSILSL